MNTADRANLEQMQKEATRRAREMQQRATPAPTSGGIPPMPNFVQTPYGRQGQTPPRGLHMPPPPQPPKPQPAPPQPPKPQAQSGLQLLKMLNFGNLKLQGDTLLVVMLLLLLAGDGADELLLLALVYILL